MKCFSKDCSGLEIYDPFGKLLKVDGVHFFVKLTDTLWDFFEGREWYLMDKEHVVRVKKKDSIGGSDEMTAEELRRWMQEEMTGAQFDIDAANADGDKARLAKATRKARALYTVGRLLETYSMDRYQEDAARTIAASDAPSRIQHALYGLAAETGELHGIHQKTFQGHEFDPEHAKKELGDILWMVAEYATGQGWKLSDVARTNIDKLKARYPNGFKKENSLNRSKDDV